MRDFLLIIIILALAIPTVALLYWKLIFLRNPERHAPEGEAVLAAADGKVLEILRFNATTVTMLKGEKRYRGIVKALTSDVAPSGYIVSVFMSPLNVHYNRAPIAGHIKSVVHSDGRLLPVNTIEAGLVNEKTEIVIEGSITVKVIQIAGFLARRIETFVKPGEEVSRNQLVGLINLGSQVSIVLPEGVDILVKKGDRVRAGETEIAKIKHS
ncbi:MAG TPA: phosphatidylserine decarboxylase [Patescibacteria group bacterium]|nr:phosphatidylserine decarboxylase [Patescibacteria group bacterium]